MELGRGWKRVQGLAIPLCFCKFTHLNLLILKKRNERKPELKDYFNFLTKNNYSIDVHHAL